MARGSAQADFAEPAGKLSEDAGLWHAYAKRCRARRCLRISGHIMRGGLATIHEVRSRAAGNADGTGAYRFCIVNEKVGR